MPALACLWISSRADIRVIIAVLILTITQHARARNGADIARRQHCASPIRHVCGLREFEIRDLDGYVLCFGQDVPAAAE
jgi:hypothetical protein